MRTLALIVVCVIAACGDDGASPPDASLVDATVPDAPPREVVTSTQALAPGELVELILTGGPDDLAVIGLSAPAASMGWNIHGHVGGATQIVFEEHDTMTVSYPFVPPADGDWYVLVRNEGQINLEVQVEVGIYGQMTWRWQ